MIKATLRLFKAVQVEKKLKGKKRASAFGRTVKYGYIFDPSIPLTQAVINAANKVIGLSGEQANASFHKSWAVVRDTPMETLVVQQIVHYLTTYGFEELGIYDSDTVYIPKEELDVPEIKSDLPLVVIHALTREEILEKIIKLGSSGVALMQETLDDLMVIVRANRYRSSLVGKIKNREFKSLLYDYYKLAPKDPVEFLRYVITKLTGESLLIKNDRLIEKIKSADGRVLDSLIYKAPADLASIFFRFKPLFLAMKSISSDKSFFNLLRKRANRMHKPMPEDYLNAVTAHIKHKNLSLEKLSDSLEGVNVFRKVRLANALMYRLHHSDFIVYRIRNGRGWADDFKWPSGVNAKTVRAYSTVYDSIASDLAEIVDGKVIYIPPHLHYTVPATEKQFTGNFPTGTSVSVSGDTLVGIHWTNTKRRIDLDLSIIGQSGKLGWDAGYRSDDLRIVFSGDMTDAPRPNGASELFYFNGVIEDTKILMVNFYNYNEDEVECELLVAQDDLGGFDKHYVANPNKIMARTKINISKKQNVIGLLAETAGENRVYFSNVSVGNSITSLMNNVSMRSRSYLIHSVTGALELRPLLIEAGAEVVDEMGDFVEEEDFVDLSPEAIDKTTILGLMTNPA